jgi:hypothetical protein
MYAHRRKERGFTLFTLATAALLAVTTEGVGLKQIRHRVSIPHEPQAISDSTAKRAAVPIVPGLSGWGVDSFGGSGRHLTPPSSRVIVVTSLKDRGPGTLRSCVEASGPRTCVFEVGGVIALSTDLKIKSPYITVAGQTAPEPGISLVNAGIRVATHDVLIQHLAIRPGDSPEGSPPQERDGISIGAPPPQMVRNVVIDHVSLTWAIDENLSTGYDLTRDITIANSIIAEGLYDSIHPKGPHSKGILIGDYSKRISLQRNLLANNEERNPYLKPGTQVEFINNVVYGWGPRGPWSLCNLTNNEDFNEPVLLNFIGNVYRAGPSSAEGSPVYAKRLSSASRIYLFDSISDTPSNSSALTGEMASLPPNIRTATQPMPSLISRGSILRASEVEAVVLRTAGSRPFYRAIPDKHIISNVEERRGGLKDCTATCRRATGTITHTRSSFRSLDLPPSPSLDDDGDGYTNLENWLHRFALHVQTGNPL